MQSHTQSYITTAATLDLFTFKERQDHLRVVEVEDLPDLEAKTKAAIGYVEELCDRDLLTTTRTLKLDYFPACVIRLDRPPWQSVTSITYLDTAGDSQTLSTDYYGFNADRGRIYLKYGKLWPSTYSQADSVTITFVSGWSSAASVPAAIRQAVLRELAFQWEYRGDTEADHGPTEMTVRSLLGNWTAPRY